MSHVHRLRTSDRIFFVTVNLRRALAPLAASEYEPVAEALRTSRQKLGFLFLGYVLMPDHGHALIWPAFPLALSRGIQNVKWMSSRSLNRERKSSGPVWRHQFWDRFVRHAQELRERLDYMHLNPVRKGLVKRPEDWSRPAGSMSAINRRRGEEGELWQARFLDCAQDKFSIARCAASKNTTRRWNTFT